MIPLIPVAMPHIIAAGIGIVPGKSTWNNAPSIPPAKSVGVKSPATPPPEFVAELANPFRSSMPVSPAAGAQLVPRVATMLPVEAAEILFAASCASTW